MNAFLLYGCDPARNGAPKMPLPLDLDASVYSLQGNLCKLRGRQFRENDREIEFQSTASSRSV